MIIHKHDNFREDDPSGSINDNDATELRKSLRILSKLSTDCISISQRSLTNKVTGFLRCLFSILLGLNSLEIGSDKDIPVVASSIMICKFIFNTFFSKKSTVFTCYNSTTIAIVSKVFVLKTRNKLIVPL